MYNILFSAFLAAISVANADLLNNKSATIQESPYVVAIESNFTISGGFISFVGVGAIISPSYVVTVRTPAWFARHYRMMVRAGSDSWVTGGSLHSVKKAIIHEEYGMQGRYYVNDIALLEVSPPFQLDKTRDTIELFDGKAEAGAAAVATGFRRAPNKTLYKMDSPVIGKADCQTAWRSYGDMPDKFICSGKNFCSGDQGTTLAINGRLAGVLSTFENNCDGFKPALFTRIADYRDWIAKHIQTKSKK